MMKNPVRRLGRGVVVGLGATSVAFASAVLPIGAAVAADAGDQVSLMTLNDFHGALGGAAGVACVVETVRAGADTSFLFSAGDNVGGSAFASAVQNDEPTIDVLNALGVDASALGNHEFDQGYQDILDRLEPRSDFPLLASNVYYTATGESFATPYTVVERDGVKVAVVGAVTTKTVGKVSPLAIEGLEFRDPVQSVNDAIAQMEADGVEYDVLVANYHEGASVSADPGEAPANTDPIFDRIVTETSPEVDAIFNGDSHRTYSYNAPVPGQDGEVRPIVQTGASAQNVGVVSLALGADGDWDVVGQPENRPTAADCAIDTEVTRSVSEIAEAAIAEAEIVGAVPVGSVAGDVTTSWDDSKAEYVDGVRTASSPVQNQATTKGDNRTRHSAAGDMLADSMKWYLEDAGLAGDSEVIGFMNPGGIRAELWYDQSTTGEGEGVVTYAEANSVVPFGNTLNSGEVTGAQFEQMLEEQWQRTAEGGAVGEGSKSFLAFSVSANVEYVVDSTRALDDRIVEIRVNGEPIDPDGTYTIVTASFLFEGGDNMWTLAEAQNVRDSGVLDRDAFIQYLEANPDLASDYSQRQAELQVVPGDGTTAPALRVGLLESQSLGAPEITSVSVDAGELGTFEAPYVFSEELGAYQAEISLEGLTCLEEGAALPLTVSAPESGTEIVTELSGEQLGLDACASTPDPEHPGKGNGPRENDNKGPGKNNGTPGGSNSGIGHGSGNDNGNNGNGSDNKGPGNNNGKGKGRQG